MNGTGSKINIKGTFADKEKLTNFIEAFNATELSKHQRRKKRIRFLAGSGTYVVTLYFTSTESPLLHQTFKGAELKYWSKQFKLIDNV